VMLLKDEFLEEYDRYKLGRDIFMEKTINYQEDFFFMSCSV
jgi:hypothetical protein